MLRWHYSLQGASVGVQIHVQDPSGTPKAGEYWACVLPPVSHVLLLGFCFIKQKQTNKKRQAIKAMERSLCFLKECGESNEGLASLRRKTLSSWWFWINGSSHYTAQGRGTKPRCALENTLIKWKLLPLFHPRKALLIITQHQHGLVVSSNIFFLPTIFCSSFILLQRNWRNLTWFRVKIMYVRTPFVRLGGNTGLQLTSCSTILPGEAALLPSLPVSSPFLLLLKKK